ncbi:phosphoribosyltransferase-like protein [Sulfuricella denitrificans]|uniref:phosphoribosyltransferase-like protein n=1 Tax=Sulfuricella denitrificans TaxID=649841 RepID=UPI0011D1B363|nr:hypothetical protein [Sulfuricella denitrificans]
MASHLFSQYEPTKIASPRITRDFLFRLERWLEGLKNDDDRWAAFRSIEYLFFVGQGEIEELYRCAHDHLLVKWLVELESLDIFSPDIESRLQRALKVCWPCPVTDSLRINGFLHLTGLKGQDLRPDWMSLSKLGSPEKIRAYIKKEGIKYLVLLEDFVGSGGQISRALKFAASTFDGPILVVPLIICAPGDRKIKKDIIAIGRKNISYEPMLILDDTCLVSKTAISGEPKLFEQLRKALKTSYKHIGATLDGEEFGWKYVGSLAVMYSNCPNNTPPMFYYKSLNWKPVFPRAARN